MSELDLWKQLSISQGFRFEVDPDGTERMYRPDGTLALTAKKPRGNAISPSQSREPEA